MSQDLPSALQDAVAQYVAAGSDEASSADQLELISSSLLRGEASIVQLVGDAACRARWRAAGCSNALLDRNRR